MRFLNKKNDFILGLVYLAIFGFIYVALSISPVCAYTSGTYCGGRAEKDYAMGTSPSSGTGTFCATGWARDVYESGKYTIHYLLDLPTPYPRSSNSVIWPQGWHWTCTKSGSTTQNCYASECSNRDACGVCTSNCGATNLPGCGDSFVGDVTDNYYNSSAGETQVTDDGTPPTALDTAAERCYTGNGGTTDGGVTEGYYDDVQGTRDFFFHWACNGPNHTCSTTYHHNSAYAAYKKLNAGAGAKAPQTGGIVSKTNTASTACYPTNLVEPSTAGHAAVAPDLPQVIGLSEDANYWYWTCGGVHGGANAWGSQAKPVNGVCGVSTNTCAAGTVQDTADGSCTLNWNCLGVNGGSAVSCHTDVAAKAGICGVAKNTCSYGSFQEVADTTTYNWNCLGTCGGATAACHLDDTCSIDAVSASPSSGTNSFTTTFTRSGTNVSSWYNINYGDGTTGTSLTHTYTYKPTTDVNGNYTDNTYVATFYGRSPLGNECTVKTVVITVNAPAQCSANLSPATATLSPVAPNDSTNQIFTLGITVNFGTINAKFENGKGAIATVGTGISALNTSRTESYAANSADINNNLASSSFTARLYGINVNTGNKIVGCEDTSAVTVVIPDSVTNCDIQPTSGGVSPLVVKAIYKVTGGLALPATCDMGDKADPDSSDKVSKNPGFFYTYKSPGTYTMTCSISTFSCSKSYTVKSPKSSEGSEVAP